MRCSWMTRWLTIQNSKIEKGNFLNSRNKFRLECYLRSRINFFIRRRSCIKNLLFPQQFCAFLELYEKLVTITEEFLSIWNIQTAFSIPPPLPPSSPKEATCCSVCTCTRHHWAHCPPDEFITGASIARPGLCREQLFGGGGGVGVLSK
jgi:hypothetical protein